MFLSKSILKLRKLYSIVRNFFIYYETQLNFHKMYLLLLAGHKEDFIAQSGANKSKKVACDTRKTFILLG